MQKPPLPHKLDHSRSNTGIVSHSLMGLERSDYRPYAAIALHKFSHDSLYGYSIINKIVRYLTIPFQLQWLT